MNTPTPDYEFTDARVMHDEMERNGWGHQMQYNTAVVSNAIKHDWIDNGRQAAIAKCGEHYHVWIK